MPFAVRVSLEKDGAGSVFGSVGGDSEGSSEVREMKDWF